MWGAILGLLGAAYSGYQQWAQAEEAKKAQKKQRKQDAWDQLMAAAGGFSPPRSAPAQARPVADYGQAISQAAGAVNAYTGQQTQQAAYDAEQSQKAEAAELAANQFEETARHNRKTEEIQRARAAGEQHDYAPPASWGSGGPKTSATEAALFELLKQVNPRAAGGVNLGGEAPSRLDSLKKEYYDLRQLKRMGAAVDEQRLKDLEDAIMREYGGGERGDPLGLGL